MVFKHPLTLTTPHPPYPITTPTPPYPLTNPSPPPPLSGIQSSTPRLPPSLPLPPPTPSRWFSSTWTQTVCTPCYPSWPLTEPCIRRWGNPCRGRHPPLSVTAPPLILSHTPLPSYPLVLPLTSSHTPMTDYPRRRFTGHHRHNPSLVNIPSHPLSLPISPSHSLSHRRYHSPSQALFYRTSLAPSEPFSTTRLPR